MDMNLKEILNTEQTLKQELRSPEDRTKYLDIKIDPEHSLESIT